MLPRAMRGDATRPADPFAGWKAWARKGVLIYFVNPRTFVRTTFFRALRCREHRPRQVDAHTYSSQRDQIKKREKRTEITVVKPRRTNGNEAITIKIPFTNFLYRTRALVYERYRIPFPKHILLNEAQRETWRSGERYARWRVCLQCLRVISFRANAIYSV